MGTASSFSSIQAYLQALHDFPTRILRRALSTSSDQEEISRSWRHSGTEMRKSLKWPDLISLGIGGMVGAGVFVTTGRASSQYAGPACILSYALAGLCALLSALCYTEFAVELPVAGGAFSYLRVTFGEFPAFLAGVNLIVDYLMSNAAVARSFTPYLATALGLSSSSWRITLPYLPLGFNELDPLAVFVVLSITIVICYSTKESSLLNMALTLLHLLFIVFVIAMGFWKGKWRNLVEAGNPDLHRSGFFPYGPSGVFNASAMVYMSYIGYDAVSTMAEEVRNPSEDIPIGVSVSVLIVTLLYSLMATSMSFLLPYDMIDPDAPFSSAFGGTWISRVVGAGASFGILTSLIVAMLGQARYICVIGRSGLVPSWFARIDPSTSTPLNASVSMGFITALLSFFADLDILLSLVSIGTLFVFYMVANALVYRRYVSIGATSPTPTLMFLAAFTVVCVGIALTWRLVGPGRCVGVGGLATLAVGMVELFRCTAAEVKKPEIWGVPMMPWVPCGSIFLNVFLMGALGDRSFYRFGVFSGVVVVGYAVYGVHASFDAHRERSVRLSCDSEVEKIII